MATQRMNWGHWAAVATVIVAIPVIWGTTTTIVRAIDQADAAAAAVKVHAAYHAILRPGFQATLVTAKETKEDLAALKLAVEDYIRKQERRAGAVDTRLIVLQEMLKQQRADTAGNSKILLEIWKELRRPPE